VRTETGKLCTENWNT